jgi:hypothetical protein
MEKKLKGLFGGGEADDAQAAQEQPVAQQQQIAPDLDRGGRRGGGGGGGGRREGGAGGRRREGGEGGRRREGGAGGGGGRWRRQLTPEQAERAQDFITRYSTGDPTEGFTPDEAIGYLRQMHGQVPPEVMQRAAVATVQNLPENQRKAFADMLQWRQQGQGMVTIERTGQAHAAESRGGGQAGGPGMDDVLGSLFGTLMGGGVAQPMPQPQQAPGGLGTDDVLGGLLGTLLGGGMAQSAPQGRGGAASDPIGEILGGVLGSGGMAMPAPETQQRQQPQEQGGGGIGDILGSPLGRAVLGGIAAFAMKEMMSKARNKG